MGLCALAACGSQACQHQAAPGADEAYKDVRHTLQLGELDLALKRVDEASLRYSAQSPEWTWRFRVLKAQILIARGSSRDSLLLLNEEPPPAIAGTDVAARLPMIRGLALEFSGQSREAEASLQAAERLARSYQPQLLGEVRQAEGILDTNRQRYDDARTAFRDALLIARQRAQPFLEANALGSLGNVSMRQERYDEAVDWYKAAYKLSQSLGTKYTYAKTLGNMGWSYLAIGDLENALVLFEQAEAASMGAGLVQDQVYWRNNIGLVHYGRHEYEAAESAFQKALAISRSLADKASTFDALNNLALTSVARDHLDAARQYGNEAFDLALTSKDHSRELESLQTAGLIEARRRNFLEAEQLLQKVIRDPVTETSLRWQAEGGLADVYAAKGQPKAAEQEFRRAVTTVEKMRSSLQHEEFRLSFLSSAIDLYDDYVDFLISQRRTIDALEVAELSRARTLMEGLGVSWAKAGPAPKIFRPQETARRLNATILSYWLGAKHTYLWAIASSGRMGFYTLPPASEIEPLVQAYRDELVGTRDPLDTNNPYGQKLYYILVGHAKTWITKDSRVVVIPDGALHRLNFETLLAPDPQPHYWIDDVTVTNANSLLLLGSDSRAPLASRGELFLIGDAVPPNGEFPALPQAAEEMEQVEKYFPAAGRKVISGPSATSSAYLEADPARYAFIHFVAHGTASRLSPLDSAVILSPQGDSYKLYARDIIHKPLRAKLVTISACNGAGTRTYSGEGLVGLSWAFLRAGAHNVIAALWEVSDASTPQLMNTLYAGLHGGLDPATALRKAKLALLHSGSVYRKPFYWAPFQLYAGS